VVTVLASYSGSVGSNPSGFPINYCLMWDSLLRVFLLKASRWAVVNTKFILQLEKGGFKVTTCSFTFKLMTMRSELTNPKNALMAFLLSGNLTLLLTKFFMGQL